MDLKNVKKKLKNGTFRLHFSSDCPACDYQFSLLKLKKSDASKFGKSMIDYSNKQNHNIRAYPTWENTETKVKVEGAMEPSKIIQSLEKNIDTSKSSSMGRRRKSRFGKSSIFGPKTYSSKSNLYTQPQPYGFTDFGGTGKGGGFRSGNALTCNYNKVGFMQPSLNNYSNYGPFLGILKNGLGARAAPPLTSGFGRFAAHKFQPDFGGPNPATNIYQRLSQTDPYLKGARLPRPYGPRDNTAMKSQHWTGSKLPPLPLSYPFSVGQFGRRKRRSRRRKSKSIKRRRKKVKSIRRRPPRRKRRFSFFGMNTPGTKGWTNTLGKTLKSQSQGSRYVSPQLTAAKGFLDSPMLLYMPNSNTGIPHPLGSANIPMQYSNNQLNTPQTAQYGRSRKSTTRYKRKKRKSKRNKRKRRKSLKFGKYPSLYYMEGPNNVAYRPNMALYNGAGANTINWSTGKTYRPATKSIRRVQKNPTNPRAWVASTKGIKSTSGKFNGARTYTNLGLRFGTGHDLADGSNLFYSSQGGGSGSTKGGPLTWAQPLPRRMLLAQNNVSGDYAIGSSKYGSRRRYSKRKVPSKLKTKFGGKTIVLDKGGKISIE